MKTIREMLQDGKFYTIFDVLDWLDERIEDSPEPIRHNYRFVKNEINEQITNIARGAEESQKFMDRIIPCRREDVEVPSLSDVLKNAKPEQDYPVHL